MQDTRNSNRFPSVFLIVGVAMAAVVPAVRVFSTEKRQAPQRVALAAPGSGSNVGVQLAIEPDNTPEPRTLIAPGYSRPDLQAPLAATAQPGEVDVLHVGRIISASPVAQKGGSVSSRAASHLQLGDACDCDEDCDPLLGDQCNIVQCIVRSTCTGDGQTPCLTDRDCEGNGTCDQASGSFKQRCDVVQLVGGSCEAGNGFCIEDRCEDDGTGNGHSICVPQLSGLTGSNLSPCPKKCVGGPAADLRCDFSGQCPQGDCMIKGGGLCDEATDACYVGPSVANAIGRCCTAGSCTETTEAACGGIWLRYTDPEQQDGDGNCICPKYGSGVAPNGVDAGSIGLVRPSGLVCQTGSQQTTAHGNAPVYCEDPDGDGLSPQFCHRRCVGGDNQGAICEFDNPDCALSGICSVSGDPCLVQLGGGDCPAPGGQFCVPINPGTCVDDTCAPNTIEGGCEDGFLNIGDDYAVANGSFQRLTQFRFRGGVTNPGEDIVIEFWDATGTNLVDAFAIHDLPLTGTHDWTIEVDCWPNCNPNQSEVPLQRPIIIPPVGWVVMRSTRTIGTIDGAAAFWSQTDSPSDVGVNDDTRMWINGDPNASLGTNVMIFELVGIKVPTPLGACCDQGEAACNDTLRWECGQCTPDESPSCSSTLHDCPDGGLMGSVCQFNKWFGPISHNDFEFGGADLTLCDGLSPCDKGGCCQGGLDGFCTVEEETECANLGGVWLGSATDCDPNCCPNTPIGVDCICETWNCVVDATGFIPGSVCDPANGDADCDPGQTCEFSCAPDPANITQLFHPHECHDDLGSPLKPPISCDPAIGDADCPPIPCTTVADCPLGTFSCPAGFCEDTLNMTCEQSFTTSVTVTRNDTINSFFGVLDGDACTLNTTSDRIGWYERFTLVDPTPGDGADDCFAVTVSMCCTDPILTSAWPFISSFRNCPCVETADVIGIPPDSDLGNNLEAGFGAESRSHFPCKDGNYSATFTVPPGEYAYQINAGKSCAGSVIPCDTDNDCPGCSCVTPNPDYTVHFTVESCRIGACCVNESCILSNKLDCESQGGNFLGEGDQPVVTCQLGACSLGSCCIDGECNDDVLNTLPACEGQEGNYFGGLTCFDNPCPACPFNSAANCQQVQTIFGPVPLMDRNPENGSSDGSVGTVLADDVKFGGSQVDAICWNTGFFATPCCDESCTQNIDDSWEIRIYEADPNCDALPGIELDMSTITVLNKVEGTGQGTATWHYSGLVNTPIALPNGGLAGDTYWFEVSAFGAPGCEVRATWSRDHGNEHYASAQVASVSDPRVYTLAGIGDVDVGFCENSGLLSPGDVLGSCCTCPGNCQENFTRQECDGIRGVWLACATCADTPCPAGGAPANDDFASATIISGVPDPDDRAELLVPGDNIFATDDGPQLSHLPDAGSCGPSLVFYGDMHHDVWYSYVAEGCGLLTVSACEDADFDLMIAAYPPPAGPTPTKEEQISCADDNCGCEGGPASMTIPVSLGEELLIRVGGWNDLVAGGNHGHPRGSFVLHWTLDRTCPGLEPPIRAPAPHNILKNRYISVDPRGANGANPPSHHIRVMVDSTQVIGQSGTGPWWAGPPDADCVSVVAGKPAIEPTWLGCPVVHLTGCPIIPTTTYALSVESGGESSADNLLDTQAKPGFKWWGDCVGFFDGAAWTAPNGSVNSDDVVAVIKTFEDPTATPGCGMPPCSATHVSVTDVVPFSPNRIDKVVDFDDVCAVISAFGGIEYPGSAIERCERIACECNGDADGNGITNIPDLLAVILCVNGNCSGCINSCDVNCDGVVDLSDLDTMECLFQNPANDCCPENLHAPLAENTLCVACTQNSDCENTSVCLGGWCYGRKNRYISIEPNNPGLPVRLKVTLDDSLVRPCAEGDNWWVQAPLDEPNRPAPGMVSGECVAVLGPESTAAEIDWDAAGCGTLHITGCPIMPTSNYFVQAVLGPSVSSLLTVPTSVRPGDKWWGDTVGIFVGGQWTPPQGTVNIDDVFAGILTFQIGPLPPQGSGTHVSVADIEAGDTNSVVNAGDYFLVLLAFQGKQYQYGAPGADGRCFDDCNRNCIEDFLEPDANGDGVIDDCDCNSNGLDDLINFENNTDGDVFINDCDNCDTVTNPDQTDMDMDGSGPPCDCDDNDPLRGGMPEFEESIAAGNCADGIDNDCDGNADGNDPDC